MNNNLVLNPFRAKVLDLEELRKLINAISWRRFEAACYLSGYALIDFDEFQAPPHGYQENLRKLLEDVTKEHGLLQEFQKYKTKYRDIEETYNDLGRLSKGRIKNIKVNNKTGMIESAEPMVWIKLAMENNLWVAPGIEDAWINFQHRPKVRYLFPNFRNEKSNDSKSQKANLKTNQFNARPLHEPSDIDNIQELGRSLFRANLEWSKQKIVQEICKIYPRANCYNRITLVKWLKWANIARRIKGGRKNLPNIAHYPTLVKVKQLALISLTFFKHKKISSRHLNEYYHSTLCSKLPSLNQNYKKTLGGLYGRTKNESIYPCYAMEQSPFLATHWWITTSNL